MKKVRIIYNPTAGREIFKKELPRVLDRCEKAGFETSTHATVGAGDAALAAQLAAKNNFDTIIVAGGDGTINEVVHGLANLEYRPKVGVIPAGTTNDFARALSLPLKIQDALSIILEEHSIYLDIGRVNDQHFINIAGGGDLTELTYEVPSRMKAIIGQLAYYMKGIEMLPSLKPVNTRIVYDGKVFEGEIMLFLVANTNSVAGFEKLAPNALINDGYFDLLILKKTNLAEFLRIATAALRGTHLEDEQIIYTQAKKIEVTPDNHMQLNLDGEYGGLFPGVIENLQEHINFFVPKEFINKTRELENKLNETF